ncbi:cysteine-rich protein 2-binding protein [Prorops nasuta]|uniref:cysteine-rich protein 2-binding protein n=1 Tax=Prorops nasuta TaxID=863751 RepID=UPI0034CEE924
MSDKDLEILDVERNGDTGNICKRCGLTCDPYLKPALLCQGNCHSKIHVECLNRGSLPTSFIGDIFFELDCAECNSFEEDNVSRDKMPWLTVIILTLYNLREKSSGISKRGYFHWKSDITTFVDKNWDYLFKKTVKRKKNWIGTISGTLSHYSGIFFMSGTMELGESGWWRLIDNDPPEILIAKNSKMIMDRKKQTGSQLKVSSKTYNSPTPSDSSLSIGDDSSCGIDTKNLGPSMYSQAYVQPTETLSELLLEEDELNDINMLDIEDDIDLTSQSYNSSLADLMKDFQQHNNNSHIPQLLENFTTDWAYNMDESLDNVIKNELIQEEVNNYDENSDDSTVSIREQPVKSLFHSTIKRSPPWHKPVAKRENTVRMTNQEELYLLQKFNKSNLKFATPVIRRFYRKLAVRKLKREYSLPLLDIDQFKSRSEIKKSFEGTSRVLDRFFGEDLDSIFEQRLQGYTEPVAVHSPYTNRLLKPFIRRDVECQPLWLQLTSELLSKANKAKPEWKLPTRASVDYSYIRPQHIPAINSLCSQFFWPGIDLTECLQYPDFSCVVLYKKLVIGFAILVPDVGYNEAYISFILTRPEWRKAGIGTFMLYHLIQTCMGKDVTLHVSATNPALILYQKFGFKIEEFVQDFYDKYIPPNSKDCRHALFLRLSR